MKAHLRVLLAALPVAVLVASALHSYGNGVYPGYTGLSGTVPIDATRAAPSCGTIGCHRVFPGGLGLDIACVPTARSISKLQSISFSLVATGGQTLSTWGGFCSEATGGTFVAGSNSQVPAVPAGKVVTHTLASQANNRNWTFGYVAPSSPGLVEVFTVVNTVNGNGQPDGSDFWGFHGYNTAANQCTPVRLYVNETKITSFGQACVGSWKQYPVLGSKTAPTPGNQNFAIELHGAPPQTNAILLIGANGAWVPFDLTVIGITGCTLYVDSLVTVTATTSAGDMFRAEGSASFGLPIPNIPGLAGQLQVQAAIVDTFNGRALPVTMTNALKIDF